VKAGHDRHCVIPLATDRAWRVLIVSAILRGFSFTGAAWFPTRSQARDGNH